MGLPIVSWRGRCRPARGQFYISVSQLSYMSITSFSSSSIGPFMESIRSSCSEGASRRRFAAGRLDSYMPVLMNDRVPAERHNRIVYEVRYHVCFATYWAVEVRSVRLLKDVCSRAQDGKGGPTREVGRFGSYKTRLIWWWR